MIFLIFTFSLNMISVDSVPMVNNDDIIDLSHFGTRLYGQPDPKTGDIVNQADWETVNAEELGSYLEGDLLIPHGAPRNGIVGEAYRWPGGVVPYELNPSMSDAAKNIILNKCMPEYHKHTCIKLRPKEETDTTYIYINNEATGCYSNVGMLNGRNVVNLQEGGCTTKVGTCLHELMHAIGFFHEHTRTDREEYVKINWENVQKGYENNFQQGKPGTTNNMDIPYNYGSVLHYSLNAFAKSNDQKTLTPLKETNATIGQREGFSATDIEKINKMYKCSMTAISTTEIPKESEMQKNTTWLEGLYNQIFS